MQMELCRENLEVYAREQQQLSDERIWSILLDLLLALKSLHDRNLIHLDIKLDNILVTDDGTCKLADFGLVFDLTKGKTEDAMEGDSRYLAPELMAGRYTKAADIFSLGIATLELTCNLELPRNGRMWQRLRSGQPLPENLARKISPPLREIIVRMMKPLPEDRPTVDALLNHPIIRKLHQSRKRRSYFRRKLSSLWRFVVTAVMWFAACLRLQHRKFPADSTETDVAEHGVKEQSIRTNHDASSCCGSAMNISNASSGNRNGVSFGASRSFQDQASSLLADEDDMFDDLSSFESSPCSRNAGNIRAHFLRESFQDDSSDIDKNSAQVTPTLNNSIPVHTPTVRIVNSTPLNHHHLQHHLQNGQLPLQHSRNDSRHSSRVLWSPSRLLCFDEDFDDPSTSENGPTRRVHSTPCQVPLLNDSDSDIRPLGPSPPNLNASLCGDASNDLLSPSATLRELSISSTPNCSLLRSAGASGCDTPSTGFSSFLIKKKLCFNEENDSE
ncbi:AGAP001950-PA-like protein [Anopheles sinensis]|uniref:non-specific serine/threonine protein kinase n=1 Tax=Anopheles sinensis TaxID=74873 RepID=A0A084VS47_ANOSI|nr:AGAP001950-PA-like protein [Anopheles sinensis]